LDAIVAAHPDRLTIVGPPFGALAPQARGVGLDYAREGFADRTYAPDGQLVPRSVAGALLQHPKECAQQALRLAQSGNIETICVHGDTEGALSIARAVRQALEAEGLLAGRR